MQHPTLPIQISNENGNVYQRVSIYESIHKSEQFQREENSTSFMDRMDESDEERPENKQFTTEALNKIEDINQRKASSEKKDVSDDLFLMEKLKEDPSTLRKDGQIIAAKEDALLNEICSASTEFMQTFIWTHTMFMSSSAMVAGLIDRFELTCGSDSKKAQEVRARVMNGLRYVLMECWGAISNKNEVQQIFQSFCERLDKYGMNKQASLLRSMLEKRINGIEPTYVQTIRDAPLPIPTFNCLMHLDKQLDVVDIPAIEFARQMTLSIHNAFSKIKLYEFFKWTNDKNACKSIQTLVQYYNGFQWYFQKRILFCESQEERLAMIKFLIDVAFHCKLLNNFDSVVCIMQIFLTSPIYRLKNTISQLDIETKSRYDLLLNIASPEHNWASLRNLISKISQVSQTPCVPYIGIYLADMTFISDGNPLRTGDDLVNFDKCSKMCSIVRGFDEINAIPYVISQYPTLKHFIENIIGNNEENENYEHSKTIEPIDPLVIKVCENGEIIEKTIPSDKTICGVFGESIPVAMSNGLLENRLLDINDSVKTLKTLFGDSFLVTFKTPSKIPFVFHYDTQNILISLPIDISKPLYHSFTLLHSYMPQPFPFIPLLLDENYRVAGIVNQREVVEKTFCNHLGYFLLPIDYFCSAHTKLTEDLNRFQRSHFYYRFDLKRCSEPLVIILVDHFVCIYQSGTALRSCPVDYTHFNIVSSSRAYYYEKFPGMKMETPFGENSPLPIDGDVEDLVSLVQRLQKQSKVYSLHLIGIQPNQTQLVNGIPPLVTSLLRQIYTHDNFFESTVFKPVPPTKLSVGVVDNFNNGIIKASFNEMVALLKLYVRTSCMPFFVMINQQELILFPHKQKEEQKLLIKEWIQKIQPCLKGIFVALMRMFAAYTIINPNANFEEWAFCISNISTAISILHYIIDNIDVVNDVNISSQYALPNVYNDRRTCFFTDEDYTYFNDEVQYALNTPSSIINIFAKKNSQLSSLACQNTPNNPKSEIKRKLIGTNHQPNRSCEVSPTTSHTSIHSLTSSKTAGLLVPNKPIPVIYPNKSPVSKSPDSLNSTPLTSPTVSSPRMSDPQRDRRKSPLISEENHNEFPVGISSKPQEKLKLIGRKDSLKSVATRKASISPRDEKQKMESTTMELGEQQLIRESQKSPDQTNGGLGGDWKIDARDSQLLKKRDVEKEKRRKAAYRAFSLADVLNSGSK